MQKINKQKKMSPIFMKYKHHFLPFNTKKTKIENNKLTQAWAKGFWF